MDGEIAAYSQRLKKLSSSVVSDVLDECGYQHQVLVNKIAPLTFNMRIAGPATCFAGIATSDLPAGSGKPALSSYDIDHRVSAGSIVMIATKGHAVSSVIGGLMALGFTKKDCGGIVTDGGVRDVTEILALGLPTFCQYVSPLNSAKRWTLTDIDTAIELPGQDGAMVTIAPSDYVVGDADGVVVIPRSIASEVIPWAEHLAAIEENIVRRMHLGGSREEVFKDNPRFSHVRRIKA